MNTLTHKGYYATIEFSLEDDAFIGRVAGIADIITFHGQSVQEIKDAFVETVDFYLDSCAQRGVSPNKPYSGNLMLRVPPELHAKVAAMAQSSHQSINQFASNILRQSVALHI